MHLLQTTGQTTDFNVTMMPWILIAGLAALLALVRFTAPKFYFKYLWSQDHKMIGKQFLVSSLLWAVVGGALALGVRWQLAWPGSEIPGIYQMFGSE